MSETDERLVKRLECNWRDLRPGDSVWYWPHDATLPEGWGIVSNLKPSRPDCLRVRLADKPIMLFHKDSLFLMTGPDEETI